MQEVSAPAGQIKIQYVEMITFVKSINMPAQQQELNQQKEFLKFVF